MLRVTSLVLALAAAGSVSAQAIDDQIDRFTGIRKITYKASQKPLGQPNVNILGTIEGENKKFNVMLVFAFISNYRTGSGWHYLSCYNTAWLIDGRPLPLGEAHHDGSVVRGGVIEFIVQSLSLNDIDAIGRGTNVEFRVCNDEFRMDPTDVQAFRQIAIKLMPNREPEPSRQVDPSKPDLTWDNWK